MASMELPSAPGEGLQQLNAISNTRAQRLIQLGACLHAPGSLGTDPSGSSHPVWEWSTAGSGSSCLTISETTVKKTRETDGTDLCSILHLEWVPSDSLYHVLLSHRTAAAAVTPVPCYCCRAAVTLYRCCCCYYRAAVVPYRCYHAADKLDHVRAAVTPRAAVSTFNRTRGYIGQPINTHAGIGDYHLAWGPALDQGTYKWTIHVRCCKC